MKCIRVCVLLVGLLGVTASESRISLHDHFLSRNDELSMIELIKESGYKYEVHEIATQDGYILKTDRFPPGDYCANQTAKKPVLFVHGLFSSSSDFFNAGPKKSLAFALVDKCHDVWLANSRGNGVSMKHVNLTTSNPQFWDFSWHEMGIYDVPALVDYILKETNETSLHYIGHSQGTSQFFVFASERLEYHGKIASMHALAPVAFFAQVTHPLVRLAFENYDIFEAILRSFGIYDYSSSCKIARDLGRKYCNETKYPEVSDICMGLFNFLSGGDPMQINKTIIYSFLCDFPSGASSKQMNHYSQLLKSRKFRQFDYGIYKNLEIYGSMFPPDYNLSAANVPISLYYSLNDYFATAKDVAVLAKKLPNVTEIYEVPYSQFTHFDFIIATDAPILVWNRVIEMIDKFH